jgi:hypothetical protein
LTIFNKYYNLGAGGIVMVLLININERIIFLDGGIAGQLADDCLHVVNPITGKIACGLSEKNIRILREGLNEINCPGCRAEIIFRIVYPTPLEIGIPVRKRPIIDENRVVHLSKYLKR